MKNDLKIMYLPNLDGLWLLSQKIAAFSTLANYSWITTCKAIKSLTEENDLKSAILAEKRRVPTKKMTFCGRIFSLLAAFDDASR
jgi:hypothetical protein